MADKIIPAFTELNASPADDDMLLIYDVSAAEPRTRSITVANLVGDIDVNAATTSTAGIVELATTGETSAGSSQVLAVTPAGVAAALVTEASAVRTLTNKSIVATQLTGTIATARLGTGTADATTYLRGDQTWQEISGATANAFSTVTVSNAGNTNVSCTAPLTTVNLTANAGSGAYTRTISLLTSDNPTAGNSAHINLALAGSTNPTISVRNATSGGTELFNDTGTANAGRADLWFTYNGTAWVASAPNLVAFASGVDVTAPYVSTFTIDTYGSGTVDFEIVFSESVTGVNAADFNLVQSGLVGTIGTVTGSGTTWIIPVTYTGTSGTIGLTIDATGTGITDASGNAFSGGGTTSSSIHTVSVGLPQTALAFDLNAPLLVGQTDGQPVSTFTDQSANTNDATAATTLRPLYDENGGRLNVPALVFDGVDDVMDMDTPISLTGDFSLFAVLKGETGAVVFGNDSTTHQPMGLFSNTASASIDGYDAGAITGITLVYSGSLMFDGSGPYSVAPTVTITANGDNNATAECTIDGDGIVDSLTLTNGGTNITSATISFTEGKRCLYSGSSSSGVISTQTPVNYRTTFSILEVHRSGSTVTMFQDGTAIGNGTYVGTLTVDRVCALFGGTVERLVCYTAYQGANLIAIRAALA